MRIKPLRQYIITAAFISIGISILVHFDSIMDLFAKTSKYLPEKRAGGSPGNVLQEVLVTFIVAICLFMLNYYVLKPVNSRKKVTVKSMLLAMLITGIAVTVLSDLFFKIKHLLNATQHSNQFNLLYTFRDLFMAIVVLSCVYIIRIFYDRQAVLLENEKLLRENLQSQYESLKNQVSPHFLFNSLTALKTLITDDPKNALLYLNDLSQVLRYTLQSNENQTVSLSDEMEAAKSYIFLIKMRFDTNLTVEFNVSEHCSHYRLPPLAIQTLLENAVKHNEISKRNPLIITIATKDCNTLTITNTIQEKLSLEPGTGIGLSNLSKQYLLLCGQDIRISKTNKEFCVELPLLKPTADERSNS
jgi:sensor histidine kinase YesM